MAKCSQVIRFSRGWNRLIWRRRGRKQRKAAEKKSQKRGKKRAAKTTEETDDSVHCGVCKQLYTDDEAENWMGCNICKAWYHYWCVGLDQMLTEDDHWICERHDD